MNILIVTDIAKRSHSVHPELYMFLCWAKAGHTLTIATPPSEYQSELDACGIHTLAINPTSKISRKAIMAIRQELQRCKYDILFATNSKTIPTSAFASIGIDTPLVCYRGTVSGLYRLDPTSYLTLLHPRVNAVTCVSQAVEIHVKKQLWRKAVHTKTILKGHKLDWYQSIQKVNLQQFGIPENSFVVVAIANFRRKKGLEVLLKATQSLSDLNRLHVLIVGSNSDKAVYEKIIDNNPMKDQIHRTGFRSDALGILSASTLLVQASTAGEGLPRTVVEAMALGIPPIATSTGGAKEIITHNESGFIVNVKDSQAIADTIRRCYKQPDTMAQVSKKCIDTVREKLSADKSAEQYIDFFNHLIKQK